MKLRYDNIRADAWRTENFALNSEFCKEFNVFQFHANSSRCSCGETMRTALPRFKRVEKPQEGFAKHRETSGLENSVKRTTISSIDEASVNQRSLFDPRSGVELPETGIGCGALTHRKSSKMRKFATKLNERSFFYLPFHRLTMAH